ncbi:MAG: TRAP transporter substrate-binding protein DctP [Deltaproteobacteria bacterium]|nr:TRAP transporter substrate-binding protein DctP [Deltaproteobacteria bacterium]
MKRRGNHYFLIVAVFFAAILFLVGGSLSVAQAQPAKNVSWKLQAAYPPPEKIMDHWGAYGQAAEVARQVKERTQGKFDIKVYPPDALFKAMEAPDAVKRGAVEMILSNGAYHVGILPEANLDYGLPYGVKTSQEAAKLLFESEYLRILRKAYMEKHQVLLLGLTSTSAYNYMTRFPIHKMEDMRGKKIRTSGAYGKVAMAHGATPVNLSPAEQYMALQRGTVDGTIFPAYTGITYKMFEVAKFHSWPPIYPLIGASLVANLNAFNKLPKEYQQILQEEVTKMVKYTYDVSGPALEKIAQEEGKKQFGAEAVFISDAEFLKFREAVKPLWDEWEKKSDYCAQLVKIAKEYVNK